MTERASRCYAVRFPAPSDLTERLLHPARPMESNGLEDARFVRFVDDDGSVTYLAPYTAYDGSTISQQLLSTTDFEAFDSVPAARRGRREQGPGPVPPTIAGRYHALSRCDGERNALAVTDDLRHWPAATPLDVADAAWSSVQLGNCGSPIELAEGWLVLTHGVGAMRTYSIGALLLDLDDPCVVIGQTVHPLLSPGPTIRTATSRTSSTPAGRSATATGCSSRSASPTAGSGSPPSPSPTCWRRCPITPPAVHSTRRSPVVAELTSVPVGLHEHRHVRAVPHTVRRCGSRGTRGTGLTSSSPRNGPHRLPLHPRPPPVLRLHHATGWRRGESIVARWAPPDASLRVRALRQPGSLRRLDVPGVPLAARLPAGRAHDPHAAPGGRRRQLPGRRHGDAPVALPQRARGLQLDARGRRGCDLVPLVPADPGPAGRRADPTRSRRGRTPKRPSAASSTSSTASGSRSTRRPPGRRAALVFDLVHLPGQRGLTGHLDGVVTFDLAEADPVHREALRRQLGEPFRTVLGSLRHEVGHHYWRHLVAATCSKTTTAACEPRPTGITRSSLENPARVGAAGTDWTLSRRRRPGPAIPLAVASIASRR